MGSAQSNDDINELQKEYDALIAKANGVLYSIEILKRKKGSPSQTTNGIVKHVDNNGYDSKLPNKAKIRYFLKKEQRFLHIREMATMANSIEPNISIVDFQAKFSPALSALKAEKKLINIKVGKSLVNTFWGSEKWLDSTGTVKEGYGHNPEYVDNKTKEDDDDGI